MFEIDVPSQGGIVHEMEKIVEEFSLGSALKERALFRLWRVWRNRTYLEIVDDSPTAIPGEPKYINWSAFLKDFIIPAGLSKSTVYSRMKAYSILEWLGYDDSEILTKMSESSVRYGQSVNLMVDWNMSDDAPAAIRASSLGTLDDENAAKEEIRSVLESTIPVYERVSDALDHIRRDVVGGPVVSAWQDLDTIVLEYEDTATGEHGIVKYQIISDDYDAPLWVYDELERKHRIKRKIQ